MQLKLVLVRRVSTRVHGSVTIYSFDYNPLYVDLSMDNGDEAE